MKLIFVSRELNIETYLSHVYVNIYAMEMSLQSVVFILNIETESHVSLTLPRQMKLIRLLFFRLIKYEYVKPSN